MLLLYHREAYDIDKSWLGAQALTQYVVLPADLQLQLVLTA